MTMARALEPKGKLDAAAAVVANGPEDEPAGWHAVDWRAAEDNVRRLRQRIFTASQAGDLKRVYSLQKLMLRSRSNTRPLPKRFPAGGQRAGEASMGEQRLGGRGC
jgi:RNA-directed DNA polymerase